MRTRSLAAYEPGVIPLDYGFPNLSFFLLTVGRYNLELFEHFCSIQLLSIDGADPHSNCINGLFEITRFFPLFEDQVEFYTAWNP